MSSRPRADELHPYIVFDINAMIASKWGYEDPAGQEKAEKLSEDLVAEAYQELSGVQSVPRLDPRRCHLGTAAEAPDLMFLLEQLQTWLGTSADLMALGRFALIMLKKLRERLEDDRPRVVFSAEMVEGICLWRLHERVGLDIVEVSVHSESFESFWSKGGETGQPTGNEVYLVWVSAGDDTYQLLADSNGRIWGEYRVNRDTNTIEPLAAELTSAERDE